MVWMWEGEGGVVRVGKGAGYSSNTCAEVRTLPSSSVVPQSSGWWRDCSPVQHLVQTARPHTCSGKGEDMMAGEGGIGYSPSVTTHNTNVGWQRCPCMVYMKGSYYYKITYHIVGNF